MKRTAIAVYGVAIIGLVGAAHGASSDNYQCWKAKDLKTPQFVKTTVSVKDAFNPAGSNTDLKKPFLLCAAASINGSPIDDPDARLTCYKVKGAKLPVATSHAVVDQFSSDVDVSIKKVFVVCVPASSTP